MAKKRSGKVAFKLGRDAKTGEFVSKDYAKRHPATTVTETVRRGSGQIVNARDKVKPRDEIPAEPPPKSKKGRG